MLRKIVVVSLLITGFSLLLTGGALAEIRPGAFTLTPMAGYHVIDGAMDLDSNAAFGLALGYNIGKHWGIEGDIRYTPTQLDQVNDTDVDIWTFGLGALYHFQPEQNLSPYLTFGVGGMSYDIDRSGRHGDEDVMTYLGAGTKYSLSDSAALRLDLRHILDYRSDNQGNTQDASDWRHHLQVMFGVTYQFGDVTSKPVQQTLVIEPVAKPAPMVAKSVDSDADGVLDNADKCPGTPLGVRVDAVGCPSDTDGDGVADFKDACIDTPAGAKVDARGCPDDVEPVAEITVQINFGTDKDAVTPFHKAELNEAVKFINTYPGYKIEVEGHTDSVGDADYNQGLSARRAENVRKALVEKYGVAADRLSARGFGEKKPIVGNATAEGRQHNRRVEIEILP